MSVYVDELRSAPPRAPRCFRDGACHMTADTLDELHEMARRIGMRREWFQDHPLAPHYDLTLRRRAHALTHGALFRFAKEQARQRIRLRKRQ